MKGTSSFFGFAAGASIWLPIVAIAFGLTGPWVSSSVFWRAFAGGFVGLPAMIAAIIFVVWIAGASPK